MGSSRAAIGGGRWSVYDSVRSVPSSPDALMAEVDAAISAVEYVHATALLDAAAGSQRRDARRADRDYRSGCEALSSGNFGEALRCFQSALASCPPDKGTAVAKLKSLIAIASEQVQNPP